MLLNEIYTGSFRFLVFLLFSKFHNLPNDFRTSENNKVLHWPVLCYRGLFVIDDKGNLRQMTVNDLPVGRSVDETLRLVQAFQFTDKHGEGKIQGIQYIFSCWLVLFPLVGVIVNSIGG